MAEAQRMHTLKHPNVIAFYGLALDVHAGAGLLLMEYARGAFFCWASDPLSPLLPPIPLCYAPAGPARAGQALGAGGARVERGRQRRLAGAR